MTETSTLQNWRRLSTFVGGTTLTGALLLSGAANADAALADLVEQVGPTVVTIIAENDAPAMMPTSKRHPNMPSQKFSQQFGFQGQGPQGAQRQPSTGLGSGFILEQDGLIVTNFHVIDDATEITVRLSDGTEFDAEIIGTDPQTDLALLSIDAGKDLPTVVLGDSDEIRVGEDVVAVGNPFGLGGTVTSGIVSAKNRSIGVGPYADFLQTDAAINKGNSGGPLFNMDGEVVGVNSAMFSPSGGSVGLGFAVTSNIVELITDDLRDDGQVDRGWLGVSIQNISPDLAVALGQETSNGVLVSEVVKGGPSDGAIKVGDVITAFDGNAVSQSRDLPKFVAAAQAGEVSKVSVIRNGESLVLDVTIGQHESARANVDDLTTKDGEATKFLGVSVAPLTPENRSALGVDETATGMVIMSVVSDSPAAKAGIQSGDVIVKLGDKDVQTLQSLKDALQNEKTDPALVLINRGGHSLFLAVEIA
ncbi:MAG: Do family serine endopeptidase [Shimia thalassica]|uniref:Do family serine endopeptidase n=1 Tax=Shimia thalassica TaxID=1715693 RepID=UPI003299FAED